MNGEALTKEQHDVLAAKLDHPVTWKPHHPQTLSLARYRQGRSPLHTNQVPSHSTHDQ